MMIAAFQSTIVKSSVPWDMRADSASSISSFANGTPVRVRLR